MRRMIRRRTQRFLLVGSMALLSVAAASLWAGPLQNPVGEAEDVVAASAGTANSTPDIQEAVRRFAEKEEEFAAARENYTYRQIIKVQELSSEGEPGGTYEMHSDIIFTGKGTRTEKVVFAPVSTLRKIGLTPEDERDIRSIQPFVLTTEDLPDYNVQYQGRQKVDALSTLVFRITPKQLEPGQRYFDGLVWVDDLDYQIVKTYGKAVPDNRKKGYENLSPRFETYREQIDGKYWFPTWTGADDTLYFANGPQRIRMLVRYENYKQFKSETTITYGDEAEQPPQLP